MESDDSSEDNQSAVDAVVDGNIGDNDLLTSVRERALTALVPLLDEMEDTPERKFDICLAAIRSTDSSNLLEKALTFANQIEDKTQKAQALIDIANEATVRLQAQQS